MVVSHLTAEELVNFLDSKSMEGLFDAMPETVQIAISRLCNEWVDNADAIALAEETAQDEAEEAERKMEDLVKEVGVYEDKVKELKLRNADLENEIKGLKIRLNMVTRDRDRLEKACDAAEARVETLEDDLGNAELAIVAAQREAIGNYGGF